MRRTVIRIGLAITAAFLLALVPEVGASASDFDPAYYAARYPDVYEAFGDNPIELYYHYLNFGMTEGRFKNAEEEKEGVASCSIDTYVDVDIENQTVTYFLNGEVVLSCPCVSGRA